MSTECEFDYGPYINKEWKRFETLTEIAAILEDHKRADGKFASQQEANKFFQSSCRELEKIPDWLLFELLAVLEKVPEPKTILLGVA